MSLMDRLRSIGVIKGQNDENRPFDLWFNLTLNRAYANIQPTRGPSIYAQKQPSRTPGQDRFRARSRRMFFDR